MNDKNLKQRAIFLAVFTVAYNLLEGVISIYFGLQEDSVALWGFGFDSFIEAISAFIILFRFSNLVSESKAIRMIAILFFLLAAATIFGSFHHLLNGMHPATTLPGTIIAVMSLIVMAWLWRAKIRLAEQFAAQTHPQNHSGSLFADAACAKACMQLSAVLLLGSLIHVIAPILWWADSVAAILIAGLIVREGWCQWQGDHCHTDKTHGECCS